MTSILKADTIQDAAGNNIINENANTITIGASGDTVNIPSGATFNVNGTAGTGLGGLAGMDMWRQTADTSSNAQPITANWERVDTNNFAGIGTAFSAPSSGVWTFPSTGIWEVEFEVHLTNTGGDTVANTAIQITTNNGGAWNIISLPQAGASSDFRATIAGQVVTDVTDTGQVKFKLDIDNLNGTTMKGSTDYNYTYVLMKKLGET